MSRAARAVSASTERVADPGMAVLGDELADDAHEERRRLLGRRRQQHVEARCATSRSVRAAAKRSAAGPSATIGAPTMIARGDAGLDAHAARGPPPRRRP